MSIFDTLFGGSSQTSSSTPKDITPPEYTGLRSGLADYLKSYLTGGAPSYSGPLVAPMDAGATSAVNAAQQPAPADQPFMTAAKGELTSTLGGDASKTNPFLQQMIDAATRPITNAFNENVVPGLISRFTSAGQDVNGSGSSAFATEARKASDNYLQQIADTSANLSGQSFEAERQRQQDAVAQSTALQSQISQDDLARLNTRLQASLLPQLIQDLGVQRGLEEFDKSNQTLLQALAIAAQLSAPTPVNSSVSKGGAQNGIIPGLFG